MPTETQIASGDSATSSLIAASATAWNACTPLNNFLLPGPTPPGRDAVLIIDEAQDMPDATLEMTRLLSNLETATQKLLQIVLVGQPELREKLAKPSLRQFAQRITVRFHLRTMSARKPTPTSAIAWPSPAATRRSSSTPTPSARSFVIPTARPDSSMPSATRRCWRATSTR